MSALAIFSFENSQVRTLGSAESPLFVAIDIAKALGYQNLVRSVNDHVDPEDLTKQEIKVKYRAVLQQISHTQVPFIIDKPQVYPGRASPLARDIVDTAE